MTGTLFISTVTGTLDGKGRVCIPAPWRDVLTAQGTAGVYIRPAIVEAALEGFGETLMQRFSAARAAGDPFSDAADMDDDHFLTLATTQLLPRDDNGRVRLPDEFIAHAALKERVTFVGIGDRFQIWEPEAFAAMQAERLLRLKARRESQKVGGA